jgi:hypothetical protein
MGDAELVLVYATGGDSALREACFELLEQGAAIDVDLLDATTLFIAPNGKRRVGASGRGVSIVAPRAKLSVVFARLRAIENVQAYALPVLERL